MALCAIHSSVLWLRAERHDGARRNVWQQSGCMLNVSKEDLADPLKGDAVLSNDAGASSAGIRAYLTLAFAIYLLLLFCLLIYASFYLLPPYTRPGADHAPLPLPLESTFGMSRKRSNILLPIRDSAAPIPRLQWFLQR